MSIFRLIKLSFFGMCDTYLQHRIYCGIFCQMISCRSRFKKSNEKHFVERKSGIQRNTWSSCSSSLTLKGLCALISLIIVLISSEHYGPSLRSEGSYEANQQTMLEKKILKIPRRGKNTILNIP